MGFLLDILELVYEYPYYSFLFIVGLMALVKLEELIDKIKEWREKGHKEP